MTVYFNNPEVDFGTPPAPETIGFWDEYTTRPPLGYDTTDWEAQDRREKEITRLKPVLIRAEQAGQFAEVATVARQMVSLGAPDQEFLRDRADVARQNNIPAAVRVRYFADTRALRTPQRGAARQRLLALTGPLRGNALYAVGGNFFDGFDFVNAARYYGESAKLAGPRQLSASFMVAQSSLRYAFPYDDESPTLVGRSRVTSAADQRAWLDRARSGLRPVLAQRGSRLYWPAVGSQGRIEFVQKRYGNAALTYLEQIRTARSQSERVTALSSLRRTLRRLSPADARTVRTGILANPALFEPYAEYRMYHFDRNLDRPNDARARNLPSLMAFAEEVLKQNPRAPISANTMARIAEARYLSKNYSGALEMADAALRAQTSRGDLATYVKAASLDKLKRESEARDLLARFRATYPKSYLVPGAEELLATIQIRQQNFAAALDTFRRLDYQYDIAYLLDVRMTPEQIEQYIADRPSDPRRQWLNLALGYRHLRLKNWDRAIALFSSVPTDVRRRLSGAGSRDYGWIQSEDPNSTLDKLFDPLETAQTLKRLASGTTPESRYELASYYYTHRNLVLYNVSLWGGMRRLLAGMNASVTNQADQTAVRDHSYAHEALYQARLICLDIAAKSPNSPVAPRALYRASTATRRLADFNPWWREYQDGNYFNDAAELMKQLYTRYPSSSLAANARKYEPVFRQEGQRGEITRLFKEPAKEDRQ